MTKKGKEIFVISSNIFFAKLLGRIIIKFNQKMDIFQIKYLFIFLFYTTVYLKKKIFIRIVKNILIKKIECYLD